MARGPKKAVWERGYKSHCLWRGKEKLAKVRLDPEANLKYLWEAAGRTGEAGTLSAAKSAAEYALLTKLRSLGQRWRGPRARWIRQRHKWR